jgi:hypothetical protein
MDYVDWNGAEPVPTRAEVDRYGSGWEPIYAGGALGGPQGWINSRTGQVVSVSQLAVEPVEKLTDLEQLERLAHYPRGGLKGHPVINEGNARYIQSLMYAGGGMLPLFGGSSGCPTRAGAYIKEVPTGGRFDDTLTPAQWEAYQAEVKALGVEEINHDPSLKRGGRFVPCGEGRAQMDFGEIPPRRYPAVHEHGHAADFKAKGFTKYVAQSRYAREIAPYYAVLRHFPGVQEVLDHAWEYLEGVRLGKW